MRVRLAQQGLALEAFLRATEQTEDELRDEIRPLVAERMRNALLLRTIAEREEIEVTDDVINEAVERMTAAAQETDRPKQAEKLARSERVREFLENEYFERQLTERLIEIATEGRGAVINAWEPPADEPESEPELASNTSAVTSEASAMAEPTADSVEEAPVTEDDETGTG
jgi:trigger factor